MIIKNIKLSELFSGIPDTGAYMTTYITEQSNEIRKDPLPAMVIFPGGGYEFTSDREAEPVAIAFANMGYQCFVVRYSVAPHEYPQPLLEGVGAVAYVRRNAAQWNIDPHKICVIGFSAGGHCAGCVSTMYNEPLMLDTLGIARDEARPDAMVLSYAVLNFTQFTHGGSAHHLLGSQYCTELTEKLSVEKRVTADTPPAFIWCTANDDVVPCENSLQMAMAMNKAGVKYELHVYGEGCHGLSLCNERVDPGKQSANIHVRPRIAGWVALCDGWLRETLA